MVRSEMYFSYFIGNLYKDVCHTSYIYITIPASWVTSQDWAGFFRSAQSKIKIRQYFANVFSKLLDKGFQQYPRKQRIPFACLTVWGIMSSVEQKSHQKHWTVKYCPNAAFHCIDNPFCCSWYRKSLLNISSDSLLLEPWDNG